MHEGKIDIMTGVSALEAQAMRKTNPEILQIPQSGHKPLRAAEK